MPLFLLWMLTFMFGYDSVFSTAFVQRLDTSQLDLKKYGWLF